MIDKMIALIKEKYSIACICDVNSNDFKFYEYDYQVLKNEWLWAVYNERINVIEIYSYDSEIIDELEVGDLNAYA